MSDARDIHEWVADVVSRWHAEIERDPPSAVRVADAHRDRVVVSISHERDTLTFNVFAIDVAAGEESLRWVLDAALHMLREGPEPLPCWRQSGPRP